MCGLRDWRLRVVFEARDSKEALVLMRGRAGRV